MTQNHTRNPTPNQTPNQARNHAGPRPGQAPGASGKNWDDPAVIARLKLRHRSETRLKVIGLTATALAFSMLLLLVA
ncbi:MAG: hypothetical protein ACC631_04385 [Halocynthiibacter sp.]